jgi:hypothetical protein
MAIEDGLIVVELLVVGMTPIPNVKTPEEALLAYGNLQYEPEDNEVCMVAVFTAEELQDMIRGGSALCCEGGDVPIERVAVDDIARACGIDLGMES